MTGEFTPLIFLSLFHAQAPRTLILLCFSFFLSPSQASNDGLRTTAANDGLRIMGLHFSLMSPGLHFISAVGIISLWRPAFLFMLVHYFRLTSFSLGLPAFILFGLIHCCLRRYFLLGRHLAFIFFCHIGLVGSSTFLQAKLTFSLGSSSGLHFHLGSSSGQYFFAMATFL